MTSDQRNHLCAMAGLTIRTYAELFEGKVDLQDMLAPFNECPFLSKSELEFFVNSVRKILSNGLAEGFLEETSTGIFEMAPKYVPDDHVKELLNEVASLI